MILGIIGGVGAGKSTVLQCLQTVYGFRLLMADDIAKELMNEPGPCRDKLRAAFGDSIFAADGCIDKGAYGALIYGDAVARRRSDEIVHPAVWQYLEAEAAKARAACPPALLAVETALPNRDLHALCDEVWYIYADAEVRIQRLMVARGYTREKCIAVMNSQFSEVCFTERADYIVDNSGSEAETRERIAELLGADKQEQR